MVFFAVVRSQLFTPKTTRSVLDSQKQWRLKNKEKIAAKNKQYRAANRAKCAAAVSAWKKLHPDKLVEYSRKSYAHNPEKLRAKSAAWHAENKDLVKSIQRSYRERNREKILIKNHAQRATRRECKVGPQHLIVAWVKQWKSKRTAVCFWCGNRVASKLCHIDHIVAVSSGGANSVENLCVSCAPCNLKKGPLSLPSWNSKICAPVLF